MKNLRIVLVVSLLAVASCKTNNLTHVKVPDAYQSETHFDVVEVSAVNVSDGLTRIYYRIDTKGLLYSKDAHKKTFMASYDIHYDCGLLETPKVIHDSLTIHKSDTLHFTDRKPIIDSFDISLNVAAKFVMQMHVIDRNNQSERLAYMIIDRSEAVSRLDFQLRTLQGELLFDPWNGNPAEAVVLSTRHTNIPRLFVRYYNREYPIALPPFAENKEQSFSFRPDSVFFIEMNDGCSGPLTFQGNGIYHIQTDTTTMSGFSYFSFYKGFPDVTNPLQMLYPLRYICSKSEFNDMMLLKNRKEAVDDFWLDIAGNPERAKELIRKFYTRVGAANRYFTSYHEGWKTDRGLIYIIFGPPSIVYRNPDSETWIYGEDRNILSMTMNFTRVNNAFSDNDFELNRSQEYKETWYSALEGWRN